MGADLFDNLPVGILGLGNSGLAAALKLADLGAHVTVFDEEDSERLRENARELPSGVHLRIGKARAEDVAGLDLVVASPGIPPSNAWLRAAGSRGIETIGEIELAYRLTKGTIVAVSGTNGKTTTTTLAGRLIEAGGRDVVVAGNIGTPFVSVIGDDDAGRDYVVEVSSFQLAFAPTFRPKVAVMLNVTPDHINWHGSMEEYVAAKRAMFANQGAEDWAVLNASDPAVWAMRDDTKARIVPFSLSPLDRGLYVRDETMVANLDGEEAEILPVGRLLIRGSHNVENALAAAAAALCLGVTPAQIAPALSVFEGVEHRLEKVAVVNGVTYWNDSKATNPDATIKALEAFDRPVIILLGGRNKGNPFDELAAVARSRAKRAFTFGEAAGEIGDVLRRASVPVEQVKGMREAVAAASHAATDGDDVVLSPACASFDEFDNFEHRGTVFKSIVTEMEEGR